MRTNRDLHQFITALGGRYPAASLERYLCALWSIARPHAASPALTLAAFTSLLERAYTEIAAEPPHDEVPDGDGYVGWEHCIINQIRDLRAMGANGQLADDQKFFGIDSPSGSRWYNFHPASYLECAAVGMFGDGDDGSDRVLVPGKVVVLDASGALTSVDPADIERPVFDIDSIDWDTFTGFLGCGQSYE